MKMNMKISDYKRKLAIYPISTLLEIRKVVGFLETKISDVDPLKFDDFDQARKAFRVVTIAPHLREKIAELIASDWQITDGIIYYNKPFPNINISNLNTFKKALNFLVLKHQSGGISIYSKRNHIYVKRNTDKEIRIARIDSYQGGLLQALTTPDIGVIKSLNAVIEVINENHKEIPGYTKLDNHQKTVLIKNALKEIQSSCVKAGYPNMLGLKWSEDKRKIQLNVKI